MEASRDGVEGILPRMLERRNDFPLPIGPTMHVKEPLGMTKRGMWSAGSGIASGPFGACRWA